MEAFARHAKRAKVGTEDVLLASRKNEVTHAVMEQAAAKQRKAGKQPVQGR